MILQKTRYTNFNSKKHRFAVERKYRYFPVVVLRAILGRSAPSEGLNGKAVQPMDCISFD
jgi:hypothetical protein